MDKSSLFLIKALDGYAPKIGHLVAQMNYARYTTLQAVKGLSIKQLDYLIHPNANSIGMLLEHMAAVESWYQVNSFEDRNFNEEEAKRWKAGGELGDFGREHVKGNELKYYLDQLDVVRIKTLSELAKRNDDWLYEEVTWGEDQVNNYWKWFHVYEDEVSHRGQIRIIRKMASEI